LSLAVSGYKEEKKGEKEGEGKGESLKRSLLIHTFLTFACSSFSCAVFLVVFAFLENVCKRLFWLA
jgi:hypothetical protein